MKHFIFISFLVLTFTALCVKADLLDCDDIKTLSVTDLPIIGPKVASAEDSSSGEQHQVRDFLKKVGCQLKRGASTVKEHAKKLGQDLKDGAKVLHEKAKDLSSDIKVKYHQIYDKLSHDSEELEVGEKLDEYLANVEIINPDILKAEQKCGHGHILDSLGNCSKLRK